MNIKGIFAVNVKTYDKMKKLLFLMAFAGLLSACGQSGSQKTADNKEKSACCETEAKKTASCCDEKALEASVDELLASPEKFVNKTVQLKGRVVHTCKHSGKKMFLAGSDEEVLVKINAGEKISKFEQTLEGEVVVAEGVLSSMEVEGQEHEHKEGEQCATEKKSKKYEMICESFTVVE
jgi:hypothetical protein